MFCNNCGELVTEKSIYCSKCGVKIECASSKKEDVGTQTVIYSGVASINNSTEEPVKKITWYKNKKNLFLVSVILIGFLVFFIYWSIGKANLQKELLRDWSRVEEGDGGNLYLLELDFSEDYVDYNFFSGYALVDGTIATIEYKVISPNKIKRLDFDESITIEFNDEKTMMTFTPALTSAESSEGWFQHDD